MSYLIESNMELIEVLNAYPNLSKSLEKLNFDLKKIKEGENFYDFFKRMGLEDAEISLLTTKLNGDIKFYLKNGEMPSFKLEEESEVLNLEEEE